MEERITRILRRVAMVLVGVFVLANLDSLWSWSVDVAHHYVLSFTIGEQWFFESTRDPSLGVMNIYPRFSHGIAAFFGQVLGSAFLGIQVTTLLSYGLLWMFVVLLLTSQPRRESLFSLLAFILLISANALTLQIEIHGSEVVRNFFFAQLVGQALLFGAILAGMHVEKRAGPFRAYLTLSAFMLAIAWAHLLPAVELLALILALLLLQLLTTDREREAFLWPVAKLASIAVFAVAALVFHPSFSAMRRISKNDGALQLQFISYPVGVVVLASVVVVFSVLLALIWHNAGRRNDRLVWKYFSALGIAAGGLCLVQFILTFFGFGSDYAVKKYGFSLSSILVIQISIIAGHYVASLRRHVGTLEGPLLARGVVPTIALYIVLFWNTPTAKSLDVSDIVSIERELINVRDVLVPAAAEGPSNVVVVLEEFPGTISYLFSISIFDTPRSPALLPLIRRNELHDLMPFSYVVTRTDKPAYAGMNCEQGRGHSISVLDAACIENHIAAESTCSGTFDLAETNSILGSLLDGFGPPRKHGRWTIRRKAEFRCRLPSPPPRTLKIEGSPFTPSGHNSQHVAVAVNGEAVFAERISSRRGSRNPIVVPLHSTSGAQEFAIEFRLPEARSPKELGLSADQRQLGFRVHKLSFQ